MTRFRTSNYSYLYKLRIVNYYSTQSHSSPIDHAANWKKTWPWLVAIGAAATVAGSVIGIYYGTQGNGSSDFDASGNNNPKDPNDR